jgi:hypothetical protein
VIEELFAHAVDLHARLKDLAVISLVTDYEGEVIAAN